MPSIIFEVKSRRSKFQERVEEKQDNLNLADHDYLIARKIIQIDFGSIVKFASMAPPVPKPARRRNRKRKRRAASSDSSSSSDDSSSDESTQTKPQLRAPPAKKPGSDMTSSSESVSSDSDSESDDDDNARTTSMVNNQIQVDNPKVPHDKGASRRGSLSPPPSAEIPSFLPSNPPADDTAVEQAMKDKFRKFWMSSIAEGFKEDLEEIRKVGTWLFQT